MISGEKIEDLGPVYTGGPGNLQRFHAALEESLSPTSMQQLAIDTMAQQKIFAIVVSSGFDFNGGVFPCEDQINLQPHNGSTLKYDFTGKGDDIELHARFNSTWRTEKELDDVPMRSSLAQEPLYDVRVLIGPTGDITVLSAACFAVPMPS